MTVGVMHWPVMIVDAFITQILREQFGNLPETVQGSTTPAEWFYPSGK